MQKEKFEAELESLFTRLCGGVIEHNGEFKLKKVFSGASLTKYNIQCHGADCPRILGKKGARFRALKNLMAIAGENNGRQVSLETMEKAVVGEPSQFAKFKYNPKWPREQIKKLLADVCFATFNWPVDITMMEAIGSAIFSVRHDQQEKTQVVECVSSALQNIFSAIGTTNGCQISIDIGEK